MAPYTTGGLAGGMALGGHIRRENYEFIGVKGPLPTSAFSCGLDLCPRGLDPVIHGEHTFRTLLGGCIPEFTYLEGQEPSLITSCG